MSTKMAFEKNLNSEKYPNGNQCLYFFFCLVIKQTRSGGGGGLAPLDFQ